MSRRSQSRSAPRSTSAKGDVSACASKSSWSSAWPLMTNMSTMSSGVAPVASVAWLWPSRIPQSCMTRRKTCFQYGSDGSSKAPPSSRLVFSLMYAMSLWYLSLKRFIARSAALSDPVRFNKFVWNSWVREADTNPSKKPDAYILRPFGVPSERVVSRLSSVHPFEAIASRKDPQAIPLTLSKPPATRSPCVSASTLIVTECAPFWP
mmetsp:Transcript_115369/g.326030  ORF Transcript_115369/g.326030 Transcript_115369/m.326030 type:complete len:207 (-) Transcript_115369:231-851(-)